MKVEITYTQKQDLDYVLKAESDMENAPYVGSWTREQHSEMIVQGGHYVLSYNGALVGYFILRKGGKGIVELMRIVVTDKGKGYGRQIIQWVKNKVFSNGIHRLWLDVLNINTRAKKLYESEGFIHEGTLRDGEYYNDEYFDLCIYSILKTDLV